MNPLTAVLIWFAFGSFIGLLPRKFHPYGAYVLLFTFFPLLVIVYQSSGLILSAVLVAGAASILRYPWIYIGKRLGRRLGLLPPEDSP